MLLYKARNKYICKLNKGNSRKDDKAYQLLAHGRWFSPDTPVSSTTKTGRHDIAEILLKVALKHRKSKSKFTKPGANPRRTGDRLV
jgi:hypothetical protein